MRMRMGTSVVTNKFAEIWSSQCLVSATNVSILAKNWLQCAWLKTVTNSPFILLSMCMCCAQAMCFLFVHTTSPGFRIGCTCIGRQQKHACYMYSTSAVGVALIYLYCVGLSERSPRWVCMCSTWSYFSDIIVL